MHNETITKEIITTVFRNIMREVRQAEKAAEERRRRTYPPAHTRRTYTATTRSGHGQTVRRYC